MKCIALCSVFLLASVAAAQGPTQAFVDQTSFVTNGGVVSIIDPTMTFSVPHPGHFRGRLTFATQNIDPYTGLFAQPNLVPLWSIRNSNQQYVGKVEWLGDDPNQTVMSILNFDPLTGIGQAQIDVPVAQFIGQWTYPPLANGSMAMWFLFGEQGLIGLDPSGVPQNFDHYAAFNVTTDYPPVLTVVEETFVPEGGKVQVNVILHDSTPAPSTLQISVVGSATLRLKNGAANNWTRQIPAGTRVYTMDLIGEDAGTYLIRATLNGSQFADSQWCEIADYLPVLKNAASGNEDAGRGQEDGGDGDLPPPLQDDRYCRDGSCVPADGDKEINCTRPFVELVETPINPNCGSNTKGYLLQGGCLDGEEQCVITGSETLNCPKYEYAGTVDRSAGSVTVGMAVSASGGTDFFFLEASAGVEISGTVESPITRRCCKFTPVPGETTPVKTKTCKTVQPQD